ncbi:ATP-grasp domain-containing protein [Psychroserpens sp. XS_ASV72]|uniref:ATP-grasp domain-containing protein n=1 Tax=Psychroserpens sp. XS_ASV72 TaxID=3241293 RepID=UPI003514ADBD
MGLNLLFTCAGRRNYLINYFKEAIKGQGQIFAADMSNTAPAMVDADVSIIVPSIYDANYIESLKAIAITHKIDAIISLNDLELPILSKHKSDLESTGAKVIISSETVIDIAFDKMKTVDFIHSIGLKTPQTFTSLKAAKTALDNEKIQFPLVVKPRWGSASIGIDFPETEEELELAYRLQHLKLKKSILHTASSHDLEHAILIQEQINGQEYGIDIVNDFNGNYFGTFVRKKLSMRSGETDKAESVIDEKFDAIGKTIAKNLKHVGNLDCDVFTCGNDTYILELNPRFGGGYPFSHEAGVDTASIYIEWLKGHTEVSKFNQYQAGKVFSKCDRMLEIKPTNRK